MPSALTGVVCCVLKSRGVPHALHAAARAELIKVHTVHGQRPNDDAGSTDAIVREPGAPRTLPIRVCWPSPMQAALAAAVTLVVVGSAQKLVGFCYGEHSAAW